MIIRPSSFPPRGATSMASTAGNCAAIDMHVLADPPLTRKTECARTTELGSGWVGSARLFVRKSVPDATTRRGRWRVMPAESWVSRRRRAMAGMKEASMSLLSWTASSTGRRSPSRTTCTVRDVAICTRAGVSVEHGAVSVAFLFNSPPSSPSLNFSKAVQVFEQDTLPPAQNCHGRAASRFPWRLQRSRTR